MLTQGLTPGFSFGVLGLYGLGFRLGVWGSRVQGFGFRVRKLGKLVVATVLLVGGAMMILVQCYSYILDVVASGGEGGREA